MSAAAAAARAKAKNVTSVGKYTYGHDGIKVHRWGDDASLRIGAFCSIAKDVCVILGGNHRTDWITTFPFGHIHNGVFGKHEGAGGHPTTRGDVVLGNDVWVGMGATIMSGVTVGDGAVIAARAHVVRDVPPYAIVGGNPSRVIRHRFEPEDVSRLRELKWWDWPDAKIREAIPILSSGDVGALAAFHARHNENRLL